MRHCVCEHSAGHITCITSAVQTNFFFHFFAGIARTYLSRNMCITGTYISETFTPGKVRGFFIFPRSSSGGGASAWTVPVPCQNVMSMSHDRPRRDQGWMCRVRCHFRDSAKVAVDIPGAVSLCLRCAVQLAECCMLLIQSAQGRRRRPQAR